MVVGYLKEQFVELEKEYPGLKLIENVYYDTCNNIASLYVARNYIENKEDKDYVVKSFARLIEDGVYQKNLFEDLK